MRVHKFFIFSIITILLAACGTNEKNYKRAYDKAKEKDTDGIENTIYNRIRQQAQIDKFELDGDTVTVIKEIVTATKDAGFTPQQLKKYNVVVAQFKQLFHAKSMRSRMEKGGYSDAIIVETAEPLYYVVAASTPLLRQAKALADSLVTSSPVKLADNFPFILQAANR